jgi:dienelactone hydrolase
MRSILAVLVISIAAATGAAQEAKSELIAALQRLDARVFKPDSPDANLPAQALRQLRDRVNLQDVEQWKKIKTKADWEKFRDERIAALRKSLGPFPEPPKLVKVVTTKTIPGDGFTVENIIYESRPGLFVAANLYVPAKTTKPMPGFIIIHSHHNPKTQGELQDMGMNWARQGCLVLIPDMLGHGERRQHAFIDAKSYAGVFKPSRQDYYFRYNAGMQLSLMGESLMGWMVWDLMRGLDVLYQRPGLDKSKIVVFGSVAGGGDPCAVFAALDQRVTAAAPFNFGGPQPETKFPLPEDADRSFNYMGSGSWESTRNLRLSARDGFLPWVIVGSLAPRGLIYAHEFAWDDKTDPVWRRFQKIWSFYDVGDKLTAVKGRGSVRGTPPESTHCNNIGPEHRKQIDPILQRWYGLPVPAMEYKNRLDVKELQCWTDEARRTLQPKAIHELASKKPRELVPGGEDLQETRRNWARLLGIPESLPVMGKVETIGEVALPGGQRVIRQVLRHQESPVLALPFVTILPAASRKHAGVVVALAQEGKAGFFKHRSETIAQLLDRGIAVCLPDLRGTGETGRGDRGRSSAATSYSASELMHGRTVAGTQLQELVMLMHALAKQDHGPIALWGDSFAAPNDPAMNFAVPLDADKLPRQSEPMGGLLALLGGLYGGEQIKGVYARGGIGSYLSLVDSLYGYFPHDAAIPGALRTIQDVNRLAIFPRAVRLEALVDGLNCRVEQGALDRLYGKQVARTQALTLAEVAAWLNEQLN